MKKWAIAQWRQYKPIFVYMYLSMATWVFLFGSIFIFTGIIPYLEGLSVSPSWLRAIGMWIIRIAFVLVIAITTILIKIKALKNYIAYFKELK